MQPETGEIMQYQPKKVLIVRGSFRFDIQATLDWKRRAKSAEEGAVSLGNFGLTFTGLGTEAVVQNEVKEVLVVGLIYGLTFKQP